MSYFLPQKLEDKRNKYNGFLEAHNNKKKISSQKISMILFFRSLCIDKWIRYKRIRKHSLKISLIMFSGCGPFQKIQVFGATFCSFSSLPYDFKLFKFDYS